MLDVEVGFWGRVGGRVKEWRIAQLRFVDDWRNVLKRAWSIRVGAFWTVIAGLVVLAPMISDEAKAVIGPWTFALVFFLAFVSGGIARLLKQPGTEE